MENESKENDIELDDANENIVSENDVRHKKASRTQMILIVLLSVIAIGAITFGAVMMVNLQKERQEKLLKEKEERLIGAPVKTLIVDEDNLADTMDELQAIVDEGMFQATMDTVWEFAAWDKPSTKINVANSQNNHRPISFKVIIDETEEIVFQSTVIPVGSRIKEIALEKPLKAGEYAATCMYSLLDDDGTEAGAVAFGITLVIRN